MRRQVAVVPDASTAGWPTLLTAPPAATGPAAITDIGTRAAAWGLFDDILAAIGPEGALEHFFLDGHLAALDDYLRARPQAEKTLRAAASSGRLGLGPCKVLMDEHASSGETIVHNLQAGWEHASRLGEKPRVALLPPTWGHVGQLPQLMRQAGVDHVVVTAGPWPATTQGAFWWRSPDGSTVRAEYRAAYFPTGNAAAGEAGRGEARRTTTWNLPRKRSGSSTPWRPWRRRQTAGAGDGAALAPSGRPVGPGRPGLSDPCRIAGQTPTDRQRRAGQVPPARDPRAEYFDGAGSDGLPSITGELRPSPGGAAPGRRMRSERRRLGRRFLRSARPERGGGRRRSVLGALGRTSLLAVARRSPVAPSRPVVGMGPARARRRLAAGQRSGLARPASAGDRRARPSRSPCIPLRPGGRCGRFGTPTGPCQCGKGFCRRGHSCHQPLMPRPLGCSRTPPGVAANGANTHIGHWFACGPTGRERFSGVGVRCTRLRLAHLAGPHPSLGVAPGDQARSHQSRPGQLTSVTPASTTASCTYR